MDASPTLDFALQREAAGALDYEPCKWFGCQKERHYVHGPGAGHCHEHGLVKIQENQRKGVETKQAKAARSHVTAAAKTVMAASRELDASIDAVRKAGERKRAAAEAWKVAVRDLIEVGQQALRQ